MRFIQGVNLGSNGPVSQIAHNSTSITGIAETADGVMIENIGGYTFFVPFSNINSLQYNKPEAQ